MHGERTVMVVPTFNEALNLEWIVGRLRSAEPDVDVRSPRIRGGRTKTRAPAWNGSRTAIS